MTEVIVISLIAGSVIFGLGVISARESRRLRDHKAQSDSFSREIAAPEIPTIRTKSSTAAMSMAAGGVKNEEKSFETVGNPSR